MDPQPAVDMFSDDNEAERAERTSLLNELDGLVDSALFSRGLWACLRVADLGPLRRIVESARRNPVTVPGLDYSLQESNLLRHWMQRTRESSQATSTSTTPPQPSTPTRQGVSDLPTTLLKRRRDTREKPQSNLCRERDRNRCVITKSGEPVEVAHIFPFAMRGLQTEEARSQFYTTTETPKNLFCLAPHAHDYQGKAYLALKHLETSEDQTSSTVMFVWLPDFDTPKSLRLCTEPSAAPVVQLREDSTGGVVGLWDVTTRLPISTGSRIVLETTDPVRLPLPDADLLGLHWVLQRVAAMAGNVEPRDDIYDTDDEDDEMFSVWANDDSDLSDLYLPQEPTTSTTSNDKSKMVLDMNRCDPQGIPEYST
ncbi:HNH nuclease [Trichophyton rubrum]|nr:HNH nuclease [Trichophyton rubrum]